MTDAAAPTLDATDLVATDVAPANASAESEANLPMSGVDDDGNPWRRIPLEKPIDRHGRKYHSVIVRKPLGTDCVGTSLTALNQADVAALTLVLPRITSEPTLAKHEVGKMGIDDLAELGGAIIGFLLTKAVKAELGLTE